MTPPTLRGALLTERGLEPTAALELRELLGADSDVEPRVATFPVSDWSAVAKAAYRSQTALRVGALLGAGRGAATLDGAMAALRALLERVGLSPWFPAAFHVRAERIGEHPYSGLDLEREAGALVVEIAGRRLGAPPPVDLKSDLVLLVVVIEDSVYLLVDFAGYDLGKRPYKVFNTPTALRGPIAYHVARQVPLEGRTVVDPHCGSGTILIEAGLYLSRRSIRYFTKDLVCFRTRWGFDMTALAAQLDTAAPVKGLLQGYDKDLRNVSATKKNLKVAGLDNVSVARMDVEWLDTKLDKASVDALVTQPPLTGRMLGPQKLEKFYQELFYQADFVLAPKGQIALIVPDAAPILAPATSRGFAVTAQHSVWSGQQKWEIVKLGKHK